MAKQEKTNVMRTLERLKIPYQEHFYGDTEAISGVEVAAALLVPWPSEQFACDLVKILCGLNCDPARVR